MLDTQTYSETTTVASSKDVMRGLLVEDSAVFALDLLLYLEECGVDDMVWVQSGKAARKLAESENFDFAIFDLQLEDGRTGAKTAADLSDRVGKLMVFSGTSPEAIKELSGTPHIFIPKPGSAKIIADILGLPATKIPS